MSEEQEVFLREDEEENVPVSNEEVKEILESVKLNEGEALSEEDFNNEPKEPEEKVEVINNEEDKEANELFNEFREFIERKTEISPDVGQKTVIPTPLDLLNAILGGGFAAGALNIIVGQPGSGKTMLAVQVLGEAQKKYKGSLLGAFLDSEEATTAQRLFNLGVKNPKIQPYADITVEKVFKFIHGLCLFKEQKNLSEPSVVIWDSIANTASQKEREVEDPNQVIGYKARLLSLLLPKYVSMISKHEVCLLAINQLRDQISMGNFAPAKELRFMTTGKDMPGGNILRYNSFHLLEMKTTGSVDSDKLGFEGIRCKVKCVKNKLFSPNVEIELVGNFVTGFSNFWTNYDFLVKQKRLQTGAWNYLTTAPDKKFRTKDCLEKYNQEEDFKEAFDKEVHETIQREIIDKYSMVIV